MIAKPTAVAVAVLMNSEKITVDGESHCVGRQERVIRTLAVGLGALGQETLAIHCELFQLRARERGQRATILRTQ